MVPGASGDELRRLAALGSLAKALAPAMVNRWPPTVSAWANACELEIDRDVLEGVRGQLKGRSDVLATVYEQVVNGVNRRRLGTFFTPPAIVDHMIKASRRVIPDAAYVVDPGAGVGAFSVAAHTGWPNATTIAVDINVVTLGLLAARVASSAASQEEPRFNLVAEDYLAWLREGWPELSGPRLVLGNPPYTRHQHLTRKEKVTAREAAGQLITSGLAGLSAYFLAATLLALGDEDALCFLLPGSWCETRYGREIREWLWASTDRLVEIQEFPSEVEVFPGTQVTAMVLVVGPKRTRRQRFVARDLELSGLDQTSVRIPRSLAVERREKCPPTFTRFLRSSLPQAPEGHLLLSDVAQVRRGVATGASQFFFVTDQIRDEFNIPAKFLRPALVKPAHCRAHILTVNEHEKIGREGFSRWLLDLNGSDIESRSLIADYLSIGRKSGARDTFLARQRREWHTVELVKSPDLFLAPVGKGAHRVILNNVGAVPSNNLYGLYLKKQAGWTAAQLANWLRSDIGQARLADIARKYQGGSLKIEPRALLSLELPMAHD